MGTHQKVHVPIKYGRFQGLGQGAWRLRLGIGEEGIKNFPQISRYMGAAVLGR